jgi:class 3 adenylate cyclase/tetratricopeptide (TPR) repeat protein/ABC-type cobalamin transport system ATPase subunit
MADRLRPYLCDLHCSWLAADASRRWRVEDGSLLFFDITGFTPLTERSARRGKAGVEEVIDTLNRVLAPLVGIAGELGGDTLKFGGDALLVGFSGPGHERRACAAAWDMQLAMAPLRRMPTGSGAIALRASAAVASGPVHAFLVGDRFLELVLAGPGTSEVVGLEREARAGEVALSAVTAAALDAAHVGTPRGRRGTVLCARPDVDVAAPPRGSSLDPSLGLSATLREHLGPEAESEHRQVTVAFAQFRGVDALLRDSGPEATAAELHALMVRVQRACDRHGVTFLGTDADRDAGKVFLVTGAPTASAGDEDRMLHAVREIVAHDGQLRLRAGVNRGRAFVVHLGSEHRRTYTTMGDTTNVAARVMGEAPPGAVLATRAVLECTRTPFALTPVTPFAVKGRRALVGAEIVGEPRVNAFRVGATAPPPTGRVAHVNAPRAAGGSPLVGRDAELETLRDALSEAQGGHGRIVELVGEPGIGKSRLLAEVAAHARQAGLREVVVEGGAYSTATPYFALRAPLRALLGAGRSSAQDVADALAASVRQHLPDAQGLLPLIAIPFGLELAATEQTARLSSDFSRAQLHLLLDRLLAALLRDRATLLLVEDAHWLDDATSELLRTVLRRVPARGWAVLITRRPSQEGLTELPGVWTRIELEPLPAPAARALVRADEETVLAPHVTAALVERAHGNPFFLRELGAAARAGADLDELPETVEALMIARIDTLAPADRRLLRRAAVLGMRFPLPWLTGMLDSDVGALHAGLQRLRDFLDVDSDRVRFRHALQREAAYETLPYEQRRRLHARAGELIERGLGAAAREKADILGQHFLRAHDHERAWLYGRIAAEQARDRFAYADAAQLFHRALEAAQALRLAPAHRAEVWEAIGEAHARTGELALADQAFTQARRLVVDDDLREAELLLRHGEIAAEAGHLSRAVRWVLRALRLLEGRSDKTAAARRAHARAALAAIRVNQGRFAAAVALCRQAIDEAQSAGADAALARAYYVLDSALVESGGAREARYSTRALEIYRRLGDLRRESAVLNNLGAFAYWEGRWDDAVALYRMSGETSARAGGVADAAFGDCNIGELRSDQGRLVEAEERLRGALDTWRATDDDYGVALALSLLGRLAGRDGRVAEGERLLADALARFRALRLSQEIQRVRVLALENLVLGELAEPALVIADELVAELAGGGRFAATLQRLRGLALAQLGKLEAALAALDASLELARELGEPFEVALSLDALVALGARTGRGCVAERDERDGVLARLDVQRLPPAPVGGALMVAGA